MFMEPLEPLEPFFGIGGLIIRESFVHGESNFQRFQRFHTYMKHKMTHN
jgi:hypothetical protein